MPMRGRVSYIFMSISMPIEAANIGMWDSLILMVMALVVFGPRRLPEIGRQIGKLMYEVRKASNDFKFQMEEELRKSEDAERRKKEEERVSALAMAAPAVDSQLLNPGTPVESPYPGEGVYPPVTSVVPEAPEAGMDEPYPRVQPPSTGEPVAAAKPEFGESKIPEIGPVELTAAEAAPAAEQAPHD
jgi:sec-independent protein translocase protein TatB